MKWFFTTLYNQSVVFTTKCLPEALAAALITAAVFCIFSVIKGTKIKTKSFLKKLFSLAFLTFTVALILSLTLGLRLGQSFDSFSNLWGNWLIIKDEYSFDFSAIQNIIMFMPFPFAINFFRNYFLEKECRNKTAVIRATMYGLLLSLFIESMQGIFRIGMVQVSDLVYNTSGGFVGAVIFIFILKLIQKKHRI